MLLQFCAFVESGCSYLVLKIAYRIYVATCLQEHDTAHAYFQGHKKSLAHKTFLKLGVFITPPFWT